MVVRMLQRFGPRFAGSDSEDTFGRRDPDLAVADLSRSRGLADDLDEAVDGVVVGHHFDLDLRDELDLVLGAPVDLGVATLTPKPARLGNGHPLDALTFDRFLNL